MAQTGTRSAKDIEKDVYAHLSWDNRVDQSNIKVEVKDGKVVLTGTVPTSSNLAQAEKDAYEILGVKSVDNRLTVVFPTTYPAPVDAEIASKIRDLLQWNPTIDSRDIEVSVLNSNVALTGTVHSSWEKSRAGYIAINVEGVIGIENRLKVLPEGTVPDEGIKRDIESSLARNAFVDASNLHVEVVNGAVTLSGAVGDDRARRIVERIARHTGGVVSVDNKLSIG